MVVIFANVFLLAVIALIGIFGGPMNAIVAMAGAAVFGNIAGYLICWR